jgi:hypothetical protein
MQIELGWMDILPCVTADLSGVETSEQRMTGYVSFDADRWANDADSAAKDCAAAALVAAGGIALIAEDLDAFAAAFSPLFTQCLASRLGEVTISNVQISTDTQCVD